MSLAQAKKLRTNMTDAEQRIWYHLRAHRFEGHKFKRHVPIGRYVVDFACLHRKLVVEVDGGQHSENARDRQRDDWLRANGFHVLRFWNHDVLGNTDGVLEMILSALGETPLPSVLAEPPATPSPRKRGEGTRCGRRDFLTRRAIACAGRSGKSCEEHHRGGIE